jgi:hypothetical protein
MKAISCGRCKVALGELASGSKIRSGTIHLCATCGNLIVAEAFRKQGGDSFGMDFLDMLSKWGK